MHAGKGVSGKARRLELLFDLGVPAFFVGQEMFRGKERLGQVEAKLMTG